MGNIVGLGYTPNDSNCPEEVTYVDRLSTYDLKRYKEGFRRICRSENVSSHQNDTTSITTTTAAASQTSFGSKNVADATKASNMCLNKQTFRQKILSAFTMIPSSLSDRLFDVLDVKKTEKLTIENVISGIAWLKHGTKEEKEKLLYIIYDLDGNGELTRDVLEMFMDAIYGRKRGRSSSTIEFLNQIFKERSVLTLEEFQEIVYQKDSKGTCLLFDWLTILAEKIGQEEDQRIIELERKYNPVIVRHRIAEKTNLSINEVALLEKQFHKKFETKGCYRIITETFSNKMSTHLHPNLLQRIISKEKYTSGSAEMISFDSFCDMVSHLGRDTLEKKMEYLFSLYQEISNDEEAIVPLEKIKAIGQVVSQNFEAQVDKQTTAAKLLISDDRKGLNRQKFLKWASDFKALQQALDRTAFQMCIAFDLKPHTPKLEKQIVEYHWEQAASFEVGQIWYLVGSKWWHQWCEYVDLDSHTGTPSGSLPIPTLPPGAVMEQDTLQERTKSSSSSSANASPISRPGPIANWSLLKRSGSRRLKDRLSLYKDFHLVPAKAYGSLLSWYSGGPDLTRTIIQANDDTLVIELFPLVLRVARVEIVHPNTISPYRTSSCTNSTKKSSQNSQNSNSGSGNVSSSQSSEAATSSNGSLSGGTNGNPGVIMSGEEVVVSQLSTYQSLLEATCKALLLSKYTEKARLWYFHENHPEKKTLLSTRRARDFVKLLSQNSVFLLEIQDQDGGWPLFELYEEEMAQYRQAQNQEESTTSSTPNRRNSTTTPRKQRVRPPGSLLGPTKSQRGNGHGLVGLDNLGNTCYMSSALQCLSHTRLLCEYFQGNAYLRDINLVNRDGTEGRLAIAFGQLVCTLWSSHKSRFAPSDFKAVLSKYNRQFVGSDQHDAQELLAFLLSGLSEDLNRIVKKPYIEQPDSDGRCDRIVAEEWWQNHLKREVSVIVALFTGQYKSLLECATCHYESARFEPFTFLQLPLPESHFRTIQVTIIYRSSQVPLKTSIRLLANGRLFHLKEAIVRKIMSTSESNTESSLEILLAKTTIYHTIESLLEEDNLPLYCIKEKDILTAFELDSMVDTTLSTTTTEVVHGKEEEEIQNGMTVQLKTISATNDKKYHSSHSIGKKDFEWARVLDIREAKQHPGIKLYDLVFPNGHKRYNVARHRFQVLDKKHPFFCYFVHRRVEKVHTAWFSNAHVTRLFGVPLVIRVSKAMTTPYDLYVYIWNRLKRIFNWSQVPSPMEEHPKTAPSCDLSDLALGTHLLHTRFGFCLRYVTSSGSGCSRCEWIQGCLGCLILPSRIQKLEISAEETIAIDWDITTLKEEYDPVQASQLEVDSSLEIHVKLDNLPLSLDRCLSIFTAKEKIQEAFCGRCKRLQPATKKMDLWRLPPLLVIHLKRFCYTQTTRKKLLNFVDFPLEGLNLDAFMAKQREPRRQSDWIHQTGLSYWLFLGGKLNKHAQLQQRHNEVNSSLPLEEDVEYAAATEAAAATTNGFSGINTGDRLFSDQTSLYDLYAVVNHVGALGTGHYFAYIRSESDGKWKCFNDEQVKDIEPQKVVSSSAYILFYRRRDLQDVSIHELFPPLPPPPPVSAAVQTAGEKNLQFIKNSPNSTPSFSCASIETRTGLSDEQIEQLLEETTKNSSGTSSSCTIT